MGYNRHCRSAKQAMRCVDVELVLYLHRINILFALNVCQMGLEIDERVEAEAEGIYKQGMERFKRGNLEGALAKFDEASKMVQTRVSTEASMYACTLGITAFIYTSLVAAC